jgi:hypothetical protein
LTKAVHYSPIALIPFYWLGKITYRTLDFSVDIADKRYDFFRCDITFFNDEVFDDQVHVSKCASAEAIFEGMIFNFEELGLTPPVKKKQETTDPRPVIR